MKLNLGQFRRTSTNEYLIDLKKENKCELQEIILDGNLEKVLHFSEKLNPNNHYYLRLKIERTKEENQKVEIFLQNSMTESEFSIQQIQEIEVEAQKGEKQEFEYFDIVFTPLIEDFDEIVFKLKRNKNDFLSYQKKLNISFSFVGYFINLINKMFVTKTINDQNHSQQTFYSPKIVKFGIQGRPGLLMCINGEPVRIGRTGIYENNYDVQINFLGIAVQDEKTSINSQDYFIIDYQY